LLLYSLFIILNNFAFFGVSFVVFVGFLTFFCFFGFALGRSSARLLLLHHFPNLLRSSKGFGNSLVESFFVSTFVLREFLQLFDLLFDFLLVCFFELVAIVFELLLDFTCYRLSLV